VYGVILTLGVIAGAIVRHLTRLGIEGQGDGRLLFGLAMLIYVSDLVLLSLHGTVNLRPWTPAGPQDVVKGVGVSSKILRPVSWIGR
jgi:hypothetical protein